MSEIIQASGCVISAAPIGENDKRIVLLTRELGRISVFARGARRPGSTLMAACNPFVFGTFTLIQGRSSYSIQQVQVLRYFTEMAAAQPEVYYGFYFLDLAGSSAREGIDCKDTLNLLFLSMKALLHPKPDNRLIRRLFEIRLLTINGDFAPEVITEDPGRYGELSSTAVSVIRFAAYGQMEKLFSFTVPDEAAAEVETAVDRFLRRISDRPLKSLTVLESMTRTGGV